MEDECVIIPDWEAFDSWAEGVAQHSANHHCYQNSIKRVEQCNYSCLHLVCRHTESGLAFLMGTYHFTCPRCSRMLRYCSSFCWLAYRIPDEISFRSLLSPHASIPISINSASSILTKMQPATFCFRKTSIMSGSKPFDSSRRQTSYTAVFDFPLPAASN